MDKVKELILLSALAYKDGQYENAAHFFTTAMQSDGLDHFVAFLDKVPQSAKLTNDSVPDSDNTLAPSLSAEKLNEILDDVERVFRATASLMEEGDEIVEAASVGDDEDEDDFVVVSSTSPTVSVNS